MLLCGRSHHWVWGMRDKIQKRPQGLRKGDICSEKKDGAFFVGVRGSKTRGASLSRDSDSFGVHHLRQRVQPTLKWDLVFGIWFGG